MAEAPFLRPAPPVRYADVQVGDSLRRISLRELGDASRWTELALLNDLRPPYVVDDPNQAGPKVLAAGDPIRLPAAVSLATVDTDPDAVFLRDLELAEGDLRAAHGDLALVGGVPNLRQALTLRLRTAKKELGFHPRYGCLARTLVGRVTGPAADQLAAFYVRSALLEDDRIDRVASCVATVVGDAITVTAVAVPVSGRPVDVSITL